MNSGAAEGYAVYCNNGTDNIKDSCSGSRVIIDDG